MMTNKQKWFIFKLMKEIETLANCSININDLIFGSNEFNVYRTSKKDASSDISYLLKIKELLTSMSYDEARSKAIDELYAQEGVINYEIVK